VYHLNLKPEHISENIILVGDQNRVAKVAKHFDSMEFETQKREFKTITGTFKNKRFTVISTGIGPDNIDIVINELDALVNIDLDTRKINKKHSSLNLVRIGTSGSLQKHIPVDSFVLAKFGLGLDGMLLSYKCDHVLEKDMEKAFIDHTKYSEKKSRPFFVKNSSYLEKKLMSDEIYSGVTATAIGFYGPQGRVLRLPIQDPKLNDRIESFRYRDIKITNLEMETSAIYGLAKLLGHKALSMNAIIANRRNLTFSKDPYKTIEKLIEYTLFKLCQ
jgi:uridine phosphorylase